MLKNGHTINEIMSQAQSMEMVYEDILTSAFDPGFFKGPYDEMIFFGCGTDYNLCQSASFFTRSSMPDRTSIALPSSELLLNTDTYIKKNKKYLAIGFSRSGETTESIEVIKRLKEKNNVVIYMFSALDNTSMTRLSKNNFICRGSEEKSIAMTKAYTSFLFAYCVMLASFLDQRDLLSDFQHLVEYLNSNMEILFKKVKDYHDDKQFINFFALGNGFDYGIAVEADLKMKEMSQTQSYSYYLYEFNHGPKTLAFDQSLVMVLAPGNDIYKIKKIIDDIAALGSKILIVSGMNIANAKNADIHLLLDDLDFKFDLVRSFINIPVFQILAYLQALRKKLDPDRPKNLNFTTTL